MESQPTIIYKSGTEEAISLDSEKFTWFLHEKTSLSDKNIMELKIVFRKQSALTQWITDHISWITWITYIRLLPGIGEAGMLGKRVRNTITIITNWIYEEGGIEEANSCLYHELKHYIDAKEHRRDIVKNKVLQFILSMVIIFSLYGMVTLATHTIVRGLWIIPLTIVYLSALIVFTSLFNRNWYRKANIAEKSARAYQDEQAELYPVITLREK